MFRFQFLGATLLAAGVLSASATGSTSINGATVASGTVAVSSASIAPPFPAQQWALGQSVQQQAFQPGRLNSLLGMHRRIVPGHRVTARSFVDPGAVGRALVFLSDSINQILDVYLQAGQNKLVGQGSGFNVLADVATDAADDLYVVDTGQSLHNPIRPNVKIFAPPYTKGPKLTLYPGLNPVYGIAVSSQGIVSAGACTFQSGVSGCGLGVVLYAPGSAVPCTSVLLDESIFSVLNGLGYEAFDGKGSLYVEGFNSANVLILAKIDGGCNAKTYRTVTTGNTISINSTGGIKIDAAGHIAIVDSPTSGSTQIDIYDPPKGGSLGNPIHTTPLVGASGTGPLAFVPSGGVWVGDFGFGTNFASEYAYPAGGAPEKSIPNTGGQFPAGLAVTPALIP